MHSAPLYRSYDFAPTVRHPCFASDRHQERLTIVTVDEEGSDIQSPSLLPSPVYESNALAEPDEPDQSTAAMWLTGCFNTTTERTPLPDDEGQMVGNYILGPIIGHGGFSTIRRAHSPTGGEAAVKIVRRSDLSKQDNATLVRQRLDNEAAIWGSLSHEHILPLFSSINTPYADYFFTILCPAGSLYDILKTAGRPALQQDNAGMMFRQVVRGLRYLHEEAGLVHRDIKLENVLVDEMGVCKIGDFGMSQKIGHLDEDDIAEQLQRQQLLHEEQQRQQLLHEEQQCQAAARRKPRGGLHTHLSMIRNRHRAPMSTPVVQPPVFQPGSLPYAAPELLLPRTEPLRPHPAQDIWALGVMLYTLLTGQLPFLDQFEPRLQSKILRGVYEVPAGIGRGARNVIQNCLEQCVPSRWTIAMVDEVAWDVGLADQDTETPPEPECVSGTSLPTSRPRSPHPPIAEPLWQQEELRPSRGTARNRSERRIRRSLSRTSSLMDRSSKSSRSSRNSSVSYQANNLPPAVVALRATIHNQPPASAAPSRPRSRSSSTANLVLPSSFDSSGLLGSLPRFIEPERGRRQGKRAFTLRPSRSPSASVPPATPTDTPVGRFGRALGTLIARAPSLDEGEPDDGRGVPLYASGAATPLELDGEEPLPRIPNGESSSSTGSSSAPGHRRRDGARPVPTVNIIGESHGTGSIPSPSASTRRMRDGAADAESSPAASDAVGRFLRLLSIERAEAGRCGGTLTVPGADQKQRRSRSAGSANWCACGQAKCQASRRR